MRKITKPSTCEGLQIYLVIKSSSIFNERILKWSWTGIAINKQIHNERKDLLTTLIIKSNDNCCVYIGTCTVMVANAIENVVVADLVSNSSCN